MKKLLMAAVGAAALTFAAAPAGAVVYIGLSSNGGTTISTAASGATGASISQLSFNGFTISAQGDAFLPYPELLDSSSIDARNLSGAKTVDVYVTRTDLSAPTFNPVGFLSGFSVNRLTSGWTVTLRTYVDDANGIFGTTTPLASAVNPTTLQTLTNYSPVTGLFSVTERYTIQATGAGQANSTVTLTAVPEPASWAMMISGFGMMGAMIRRRRSAMATA